jgi:hypothetical protein
MQQPDDERRPYYKIGPTDTFTDFVERFLRRAIAFSLLSFVGMLLVVFLGVVPFLVMAPGIIASLGVIVSFGIHLNTVIGRT